MPDPDLRALCAEAAEHLSLLDDPPHHLVIALQEALAQPVTEPAFTDEEVLRLAAEATCIDDIHAAHEEGYPLEVTTPDLLAFAHLLLTRCGRHALAQPVPEPTFTDEEV